MVNYAKDAWNDPVITEAYTYGYYTDGNQRTKQDSVTGKKTVYAYDAAGRLTSETESVNGTVTQTYAYTYDASGNRLTLTASGNEAYSVAYTYDKANRLLTETKTVSGVATVKTYTYDLNGNLLTVSEGGAVTESYTYDPFGKMLSYTKSGTTTAYTYRPDGMLYTKQTGSDASTKKTYISSDGKIVFEQTGTDNVGAVVYSYGLTRISAKTRTALTAAQTIRYYYLYNSHGDVVRIISGTNVTVKTYDYDAFGNDRSAVAGDTNPFRYCGEYFDTVTETYFLRARWYDPATGRFTQQDPILDGLNWYVYCDNNAVNRWDPTGRAWTEEDQEAYISLGGIWSKRAREFKRIIEEATREWNEADGDIYAENEAHYKAAVARQEHYENGYVDNFDYTRGSGSLIYLGTHTVVSPANHACVIVMVDSSSLYYSTQSFTKNKTLWGGAVRYATLGAGSVGGYLVSGVNRNKDVILSNKNEMINTGGSGDSTIATLFAYEMYYRKNSRLDYTLFPTRGSTGQHNSNSFARGILNAVGISLDKPPRWLPGWNQPLETSYFSFGRK